MHTKVRTGFVAANTPKRTIGGGGTRDYAVGQRSVRQARSREDVHLEAERPCIDVKVGSKGGPPKNGKARRVFLIKPAVEAVTLWLEGLSTYAPRNPRGLAFPRPNGTIRPVDHKKPFMAEWHRYSGVYELLKRKVRLHSLPRP